MYELAGWGRPAPANTQPPRERIDVRLPVELVRELRLRASSEGVSLSALIQHVLRDGMHLASVEDF
jgi:predicted DNA binding CopG/RHH family protein